MKTKVSSISILVLLCSSMILALTATASAQTVVAGVSKGETFDYSYSLIWTSSDPSALPPKDLVDYNNTQKITFVITDVSGSNINVDFVRYFKNGTQTVQSGSINLESGTTTIPYGFLIIGSNLSKGQKVYPAGGHQVITDAVMRSYPSGQRETNVISGAGTSSNTTTYFDRIKGVAIDYSYTINAASGGFNIVSTERLINTNSDVWAVSSATTTPSQATTPKLSATPIITIVTPKQNSTSPFGLSITTLVAVIAVFIVFTVAVVLGLSRRRRKPKSKEETETQYLGTF